MSKVIAILTADLHLSETPPAARSSEPDWYEAMARPLLQLCALKDKYDCPVICAGDVFDKWKSPPSLINFALNNLPQMYAVPGQHDIPFHQYDDLNKSAYWTLKMEGRIRTLQGTGGRKVFEKGFTLSGFPFGDKVVLCRGIDGDGINIAVIHSYIWKAGHSYPGAPSVQSIGDWKDRLEGYDIAVFGDNHSGFTDKVGDCRIVNCGCLIPRRKDEKHYRHRPHVWLLHEDCSVEQHFLDCSEDKWCGESEESTKEDDKTIEGMTDFLRELSESEKDSLDFREAVHRYIDNNRVRGAVERVLLEALGE